MMNTDNCVNTSAIQKDFEQLERWCLLHAVDRRISTLDTVQTGQESVAQMNTMGTTAY